MPHARRLAWICRRSRRRITLLGALPVVVSAIACEPRALGAAPNPTHFDLPAVPAERSGPTAPGDDVAAGSRTTRRDHVVKRILFDPSDDLPVQVGAAPTHRHARPARFTRSAIALRPPSAVPSRAAACRAARPPP